MADDEFSIEHLESCEEFVDIPCLKSFLTVDQNRQLLILYIFHFSLEPNLLQIQDNLGNILDHPGDGGKLMFYTMYFDSGNREPSNEDSRILRNGLPIVIP